MSDPGHIVWIDLEMTGLDPERHRIIEIATLVTDDELEVVVEGPDLVVHQPQEVLDGMNAWSREHHAKSGLTDRVRASEVTETEAEERTLALLQQHCARGRAPLGGNSVHLDRRFLARYMPRLEAHLHGSNLDVSTLKELARRWRPQVLASAPRKKDHHRALDDIRESIEELRYYREHLLR
ncbi:MAG: oligoribonuclease [Polyangiales bacterium]